jgi:hypothetical protein
MSKNKIIFGQGVIGCFGSVMLMGLRFHRGGGVDQCDCDGCEAIRSMTRPEIFPGKNLLSKLSLECYEEGNMRGVEILGHAMEFLFWQWKDSQKGVWCD